MLSKYWTTILKYLCSSLLTVAIIQTNGDVRYIVCAFFELAAIVLFSNRFLRKYGIIGRMVNDLLCFCFNVQMLVLLFGNSYIQLVMLNNLASLRDLEGKSLLYGVGFLFVLAASCLPVNVFCFKVGKVQARYIFVMLTLSYSLVLMAVGTGYSPTLGYMKLILQQRKMVSLQKYVNDLDNTAEEFYADGVDNFRKKDEALLAQPNVILIFTEGLSQNIVDDSRNIMPNLSKLESKSLNFVNYYNHTFATYRGLSGQLYSGYQLNNLDENHLVPVQSIFSVNQYYTAFINTEPANCDFTTYLESFGFDEIVGVSSDDRTGMTDSYSDREAYDLLFDYASSLNERGENFFISVYTFGTHVSFDSVDEIYGDGEDPLLNKFYNLDCQLGTFLDKFHDSTLAENTILIFTSDHATYQDSDFTRTFPEYFRSSSMVDEIPLCIYYCGIVPEEIDANGRNSLDLVPTILDYLDINGPNYFLGTSLFSDKMANQFDTIFNEGVNLFSTKNDYITAINETNSNDVETAIQQYFVAKLQNSSEQNGTDENVFDSNIETKNLSGSSMLEIKYTPREGENYQQIWFPVWSSENDQNDKVNYVAEQNADGTWSAVVDSSNHTTGGELNIHVYGGGEEATDYLGCKAIIIS